MDQEERFWWDRIGLDVIDIGWVYGQEGVRVIRRVFVCSKGSWCDQEELGVIRKVLVGFDS